MESFFNEIRSNWRKKQLLRWAVFYHPKTSGFLMLAAVGAYTMITNEETTKMKKDYAGIRESMHTHENTSRRNQPISIV